MARKNTEIEVKHPAKGEMVKAGTWDPVRAMRQQFDRMLQDFDWPDFRFDRPLRGYDLANWVPDLEATLPPADLVEKNGGYDLAVDLPGMTRDQIDVKLSDGLLTIHGERSSEKVEEDANYRLQERSFGSVSRSFRLPVGIDDKQVTAKFENGVLKVHLPKSPEAIAKERKVEVKAA